MDLLLVSLVAMIGVPFYLGMRLGGGWKEQELRDIILAIQKGQFVVHENDRVVKEIIVTEKDEEAEERGSNPPSRGAKLSQSLLALKNFPSRYWPPFRT